MSVTLLRRATNKAHTISVLETDQAELGGLVRLSTGTAALYNDTFTTDVDLATGSAVATVDIGGAATTAINVGTGMGAGDTIAIGGAGSLTTIAGDLVVDGTTTSVNSEVVLMADNHIYLNAGYTTAAAQTGGLVVNYLPTATATTVAATGFVAGVPATSNPTVNTVGAATFAAGDFVQISGAGNVENNGLFEVLTHAANLLTIRGVGTTATLQDFSQNQFTTSTVVAGAITKVNVSVMRASTAGSWETGFGSTNGLVFTTLSTGTVTLQQAYDASTSPATITTNATDDEVLITGTAGLRVTGTGADNTVSAGFGFEVDTTGAYRLLGDTDSTLSVDTGNLTLSTITTGTLAVTAAGALDMDAGAAGATLDTTGTFSIDGATSSNVTVTGAAQDLTLSSVGGSVIVQGTEAAADAVRINASAGAGGIDVDAGTAGIAVDTTGALSLGSVGTSDWTNSTGTLTIQTTTSGDVAISAAGAFTADAVGVAEINSSGAAIGIGNDANAFAINIGTGAAARTVTIGNSTGATSLVLNAGTGPINIGTNAIAHTTTIGNATGASAVQITSGTGEIGLTATGATVDINFTARGGTTIQLNEAGEESLDVTFVATSIVGALNELKTTAGAAFQVTDFYITTGRTVGQPVIGDGNASAATAADASVLATSEGFVGIVLTVGGAGVGEVVTQGRAVALFEAGIARPVGGDPIYLSETTGRVTNIAPTGNPASNKIVFQIGVMKDFTSGSGGTGLTATVGAAETAAILLQPMQLFEL